VVPKRTKNGNEWRQSQIVEIIAGFGFEARDFKIRERPCDMVFLGNRPYPVSSKKGDSLAWGPTIGRRLPRMGVQLERTCDCYPWLKGVDEAMVNMYGFVPILADIARHSLSINPAKMAKDAEVDHWRVMGSDAHYWENAHTDLMMEEVYGVTPAWRKDFVRKLKWVRKLPCLISDVLLEDIIEMDTS